ncbi:type II toxin-antitoxin system RelE/ParE family toxin [Lacunimicrobium album]
MSGPIISEDPQVRYDLLTIYHWISRTDGSYLNADRVIDAYFNQRERYARNPELGSLCEEYFPRLRSFTFKQSFVAFYLPINGGIYILRVVHASRDFKRLF